MKNRTKDIFGQFSLTTAHRWGDDDDNCTISSLIALCLNKGHIQYCVGNTDQLPKFTGAAHTRYSKLTASQDGIRTGSWKTVGNLSFGKNAAAVVCRLFWKGTKHSEIPKSWFNMKVKTSIVFNKTSMILIRREFFPVSEDALVRAIRLQTLQSSS